MSENTSSLNENLKQTFKRGNINFDFLQPEIIPEADDEKHIPEKRTRMRQGKRGIFNRGRPVQRIRTVDIVIWIVVNLLSVSGIISLFFVQSFFWIIVLPLLFSGFLWSSIMLSLFFARPR